MESKDGPPFGRQQEHALYFGPAVCTLMALIAWCNHDFDSVVVVEVAIGILAGLGFLYILVGIIWLIRVLRSAASSIHMIDLHINTYFWELLGRGFSRCAKREKGYVVAVLVAYVVLGVVAFISLQSVLASIDRSGAILFGAMIETLIVFLLSVVFLLARRGSN